MKTKLTPAGDHATLVLEKPLLDELGLDRDAEVEVPADGHTITITPLHEAFRRPAEKIADKHAGLFRRLAK